MQAVVGEKVQAVVGAESGGAMNLIEETPVRWRIDPVGQMRVPGMVGGIGDG